MSLNTLIGRSLAFSLSSLVLLGCVSSSTTQLVTSYSTAAASLDTAITQTYVDAQQSEMDNRIASALNDPSTGYDSFSTINLKQTSIATRTKLADELLSYAKSLQSVVSTQASTDLATQSQALFTSLSNLNTSVGSVAGNAPLGKTDLAVVATLVDAIGQAWLQSERLKLLTQIVEKADPLVQQASSLYVADLPDWQQFEIAALQSASKNYFKIAQTKVSPAGESPVFPNPDSRIDLLQKADAERLQANALPARFQSLNAAVQKCAKAHAAILASLKSDAQIKASAGVVSDFVNSVDQLYTFYKGVSK